MTQKEKILSRLATQPGSGWVSHYVLNDICFRYGARIFELRRQGHNIEKELKDGIWRYRLGEGNT